MINSNLNTREDFQENFSRRPYEDKNDKRIENLLNRQVREFLVTEKKISNTHQDTSITDNKDTSITDNNIVIMFPTFQQLPDTREIMAALQEWEGVVVEVEKNKFHAHLIDLTSGATLVSEIAEIPLTEISDSDREKVVPGAIFRWVIGYQRKLSGAKLNSSVIYFRRSTNNTNSTRYIPDLIFEDE